MTNWYVELEGHEFDLARLKEDLSGAIAVRQQPGDDRYYLVSDSFSDLSDPSQVSAEARALICRVNGVFSLGTSSYRPVKVTGQLRHGANRHAVVVVDTIEVRSQVSSVTVVKDGVPQPKAVTARSRLAEATLASPSVAEVLQILGSDGPDWPALYKVYEIVKHDVGGSDDDLANLPGIDRREISAFTASANRPDVGGPSARHARVKGNRQKPPTRIMPIAEAKSFVERLLEAWLDSQS